MKLVIFDCDGTLVDSQHAITAAMDDAFTGAGLVPPSREAVLEVVGLSLKTAIERLVGQDTESATVHSLAEAYKASFADRRSRAGHVEPLYPGIRETITALSSRDGVVLAIATGKSRRGVDAVLGREGLASAFASIQTADTHPSKPHPSMVLTAMAETGAAPEATIMVGDTTYDMAMGRAAGARSLGVAWGYHPADALYGAGAHDVASDWRHLARSLEEMLFDGRAA